MKMIKYPFLKNGERPVALHAAWQGILGRCNNPRNPAFKDYGGRGIKVCDRWLSFPNFVKDVGERPSAAHSLDRINNNGNYEIGNVRWATSKEQNNNRRPAYNKRFLPQDLLSFGS